MPQTDARFPEALAEHLRVGFGQLANGVDPHQMQLFFRGGAEHEQLPHRKRPELLFQFPREKCVYLVWLFKVPRHLRQQLVAGNADIDRKAQFIINFLAEHLRRRHGRAVQSLRTAHIRPRLVYGILLHHRRKLLQKRDQMARGLHIQRVIRRHKHQSRAFLLRLKDGLPRFYAALFCRQAFGQNDPVPVFLIPCDRRRNFAQVERFAQHTHAIGRRPGQKSAVDINVKDHFFHQYTTRNRHHE